MFVNKTHLARASRYVSRLSEATKRNENEQTVRGERKSITRAEILIIYGWNDFPAAWAAEVAAKERSIADGVGFFAPSVLINRSDVCQRLHELSRLSKINLQKHLVSRLSAISRHERPFARPLHSSHFDYSCSRIQNALIYALPRKLKGF